MLRCFSILLPLLLMTDCCDDDGLSECHEEDLRNFECRSCREVNINPSNCPPSGFTCDINEPVKGIVLTPTYGGRCQSISCSNRGWRLAFGGRIVDRARCTGNEWRTSSGEIAESFICAKASVCEGKRLPEPYKCIKEPYTSDGFTRACFTGEGPHCLGDTVLAGTQSANFGNVLTLDSPANCDPQVHKYSAIVFGIPYGFEQISCMKCPHMSGTASTTYTGSHGNASYENCIVRCQVGELYGKDRSSHEFKAVRGHASYGYYPLDPPAFFAFYDIGGTYYDADFYCQMPSTCTGVPITGPFECKKEPYHGAPFSPVCFTGEGPHCEGNTVLAGTITADTGAAYTLESVFCDPSAMYKGQTIGLNGNFEQISCMECPHMSGPATTSFQGVYAQATYEKCTVHCDEGELYGKSRTTGEFVALINGRAAFAFLTSGPVYGFIDFLGMPFEGDFYCTKPFPCSTDYAQFDSFSSAFAGGEGPHCEGNNVLTSNTLDLEDAFMPYFITLTDGASCVDPYYTITLFAQEVTTNRVSCMACPHMSGPAVNSFQGIHGDATYDNCVVRCAAGILFGKETTSGNYEQVKEGVAYYSYNSGSFAFVDSTPLNYEANFYCDNKPQCSGEPLIFPRVCNTEPFTGNDKFTQACLTVPGPNCVGNTVLAAQILPLMPPGFVYTLESEYAVCSDDVLEEYMAKLFGADVRAKQVSCMECPYMSLDAANSHEEPGTVNAKYNKCIVSCEESRPLYGMGPGGSFLPVSGNRASYSYNFDSSAFYFADSDGNEFHPDFYCGVPTITTPGIPP